MPIVRRFDQDPLLAAMSGFQAGRRQHKLERDARKKAEEENEQGLGGLGAGVGTALGIILAPFTAGGSLALTAASATALNAAVGATVGGVAGSFIKTSPGTAGPLNQAGSAIGDLANVAVQMEQERAVTENIKKFQADTIDVAPEERLSQFEIGALNGQFGPDLQKRALTNMLELSSRVTFADIRASKATPDVTPEQEEKFNAAMAGIADAEDGAGVIQAIKDAGSTDKDFFGQVMKFAKMQLDVLADKKQISASQKAQIEDGILGEYERRIQDPEQFASDLAATNQARKQLGRSTAGRPFAFAGPQGFRAVAAQKLGETTVGRSTDELLDQFQELNRRATAANGFRPEEQTEIFKRVVGAGKIASGPLPKAQKSQVLRSLLEETLAIRPTGQRSDGRVGIGPILEEVVDSFDPNTGIGLQSIDHPTAGKMTFNRGDPLRKAVGSGEVLSHPVSADGIPLSPDGKDLAPYVTPFKDYYDAMLKTRDSKAKSLVDRLANIPEGERDTERERILTQLDELYPDDMLQKARKQWIEEFRDRQPSPEAVRPPPAQQGEAESPNAQGAGPGPSVSSLPPGDLQSLRRAAASLQQSPDGPVGFANRTLNNVVNRITAAGGDITQLDKESIAALVQLRKMIEDRQKRIDEAPARAKKALEQSRHLGR